VVLWIKACPKCGGDLYNDRDVMGYYRQCLQCGYTFYERRRRPAGRRALAVTSEQPRPTHTKETASANSGRPRLTTPQRSRS
jgi:DNA-directed RNA polymerase subunit M/transcription elongation factor TFIIS